MMTTFISQDLHKLPNDVQLAALSALRLRFDVRLLTTYSLPACIFPLLTFPFKG